MCSTRLATRAWKVGEALLAPYSVTDLRSGRKGASHQHSMTSSGWARLGDRLGVEPIGAGGGTTATPLQIHSRAERVYCRPWTFCYLRYVDMFFCLLYPLRVVPLPPFPPHRCNSDGDRVARLTMETITKRGAAFPCHTPPTPLFCIPDAIPSTRGSPDVRCITPVPSEREAIHHPPLTRLPMRRASGTYKHNSGSGIKKSMEIEK